MEKNGTKSEVFWALADRKAALEQELKALTRANGAPLGLSFGGWKSPKRRRAQAIAAELRDADESFRSAQREFAAAMRAHVANAANEMGAVQDAAIGRQASAVGAGEFAALRARVEESLAQGKTLERAMLHRLTKARPRFD
jgi:hypothetical protein